MMRRSLPLVLLGCPVLLALGCAGGRPESPGDETKVRGLLGGVEFKEQRQQLIQMGEKVFPAFETILSDPKAKPREIARIFGVLGRVEVDRGRFLEHAVRRLAAPDGDVRHSAVWLLGRIGSAAEASPVVALLSDKDKVVVHFAAKTLAAIGGSREVVAMDAWLLGASHRDDAQLRYHVRKCRDELQKRLESVRDPTKERR